MTHFNLDDAKQVADLSSIFSIIAALFDMMPQIAAIVAALWVFIRFYDYMRYVRPRIVKRQKMEIEDDEDEF